MKSKIFSEWSSSNVSREKLQQQLSLKRTKEVKLIATNYYKWTPKASLMISTQILTNLRMKNSSLEPQFLPRLQKSTHSIKVNTRQGKIQVILKTITNMRSMRQSNPEVFIEHKRKVEIKIWFSIKTPLAWQNQWILKEKIIKTIMTNQTMNFWTDATNCRDFWRIKKEKHENWRP